MRVLLTDLSSVDSQQLHLSPCADSSALVEQFLSKIITASRFLELSCFHIKTQALSFTQEQVCLPLPLLLTPVLKL